jgi:hypothetical protein
MALQVLSLLLILIKIGLFTSPIIWAYAVHDAYQTAERLNSEQ